MKKQYYKILSDDMVNNKFQYRMGLNTDTVNVPFETGNVFGLHFSDAEHIFEYFIQKKQKFQNLTERLESFYGKPLHEISPFQDDEVDCGDSCGDERV